MNNNIQKTCLLVLGMHRSGTSALTRALSLLGADLPTTLMSSHETNETGHWESSAIADFNDEILESAGTSWDDWSPCTSGWFESPKSQLFIKRAKEIIAQEFGDSGFFVLKDPRNCRIAPFWIDLLNSEHIKTKIIIPFRNPLEVSDSLLKRNGFHRQFGLLLWLRHVLDAEFFSRGKERYFSSYEQLLNNWAVIIDECEKKLEIKWPKKSSKICDEIDDFISNKYRHNIFSAKDIFKNSRISEWIKQTYSILLEWEANGENQEDYIKLDQIKENLDQASITFASLVANTENLNVAITRANQEKIGEINIREEQIANLNIHANNLQNHNIHLANELSLRDEIINNLNNQNAQFVSELELLRANIVEIELMLEQKQSEISSIVHESNAKAENYSNELSLRDGTINSINTQNAQFVSELELLRANIAEIELMLEQKQSEILNLEKELASNLENNLSKISELSKANDEYNRIIKSHEATINQNNFQLSEKSFEIDKLTKDLQNAVAESDSLSAEYKNILSNNEIKLNEKQQKIDEMQNKIDDNLERIHLLESHLAQKSAEIDDRIRDFQDQKQINDNLSSQIEQLNQNTLNIEQELQNSNNIIANLSKERDNLNSKLSEFGDKNQKLENQINILNNKIEIEQKGKNEIINRLIVVQQKLDETQKNEAKATQARERLIEQITHEARPIFSLKRSSVKRKANLLRNAGIVDEEFYKSEYKDVVDSGMDPTLHFVLHGIKEGRKPRG